MKILMTTDTVGGVWTYTMELCAALADFGVHIELASLGRALSPGQWRDVSQLRHVQVQVHENDYKLCWMNDPWDDVEQSGQWLLALERKLKPDLIHVNDLGLAGFNWHAPVVLVAHSCVGSWWEAVKQQLPHSDHWRRYRALVRRSVQNADWLVAPSRAILNRVLHFYGPARVSLVIPNGRSFPPLARGDVAADLSHLDSPREDKAALIFAAGRIWDEAKNIGALVGIAERLPWPVYIAGENEEPGRDDLPAKRPSAKDASVEDAFKAGVHYLGHLEAEHMAHWLKRTAIYVAPAHYEPFGLGILEAARAGCALVLGDIPSLREVWADAALYVPPDDADALQGRIDELIANPRRRRQIAARAWQHAQVYSTDRMGSDYLQCYRSLVHRPDAIALTLRRSAQAAGLKH